MKANKIKARMKEIGMTQANVAKMIGMSENSLSRKLNGRRDFLISEVLRLSEVLKIDNPGEIFLAQNSQIRNNRF